MSINIFRVLNPPGRNRSPSHLREQLEIPQQLLIQLVFTLKLLTCVHTHMHTHTQRLCRILFYFQDTKLILMDFRVNSVLFI